MIGNPLIYEYDDLSRPLWRNGDTFAYNGRGEVVAANIASSNVNYAYDEMGNYIQVSRNQEETTYSSNELNQYMEISTATNNTRQLVYDANGNLVSNGVYSLVYDCENRLISVSSNGVLLLTNCYDAKSRRVQKVTSQATHTFFYDDWNLIEERIVHTNGTSTVIEYVWGQDLSGTLQGAGGVGGFLYLKRNGQIFIPTYDSNGNILSYVDASGTIVATYAYDAFGNTLAKTGTLATTFNHRFSTKYYDSESRLYYYGYRFYAPSLGRWLNRDPIEEDGGINLYAFCGNDGMSQIDVLGKAYFVIRKLGAKEIGDRDEKDIEKERSQIKYNKGGFRNRHNLEFVHEHLIFEDGETPSNVGFFKGGVTNETARVYVVIDRGYNDCIMRIAVSKVKPPKYSLLRYNCQDYADDLRNMYRKLYSQEKYRKQCCIKKD